MDDNNEYFSNCSSKKVAKTDSCTKCYEKICDICQIRQDFLYNEVTSKKHSSELFLDQIYTCNKCDQSWMDKFYFCFTCGKIVCETFVDQHESCADFHSLVESDVIKRRRLAKTVREIVVVETSMKRKKDDLDKIRSDEEKSQLLILLKQASTCLQTKIEETIESYTKDSELFQQKVSGLDQYIQQQNESFEKLKERLQLIKNNTFPVAFLQNITEWDKLFKRLSQNQSNLDLSGLRSTSVTHVECKPVDYDYNYVHSILGICGKRPDCRGSLSHQYVQEDSRSETSCSYSENNTEKQRRKCSIAPRQQKSSAQSPWYSNHLLNKEIAAKNEQINRLETKCVELEKRLQLTKQSRDAAKKKLIMTEARLEENMEKVNDNMQQMSMSYEHKIELKDKEKLKVEKELTLVKSDQERSETDHRKYVSSLMTEIESLQQKLLTTQDTLRESEERRMITEKESTDRLNRHQLECEQYERLIQVGNLRIEGLKDHLHLNLEGKDSNMCDERISELERENRRFEEKINRIREMFHDWTRLCSSLNRKMAHELIDDDRNVCLLEENKLLKEQIAALNNTRKEASDLLDMKTDANDTFAMQNDDENCETTEKITGLGGTSTENNGSKSSITSISYTAKNIHIIQSSQVSLADSGIDAKSLFDYNEYNHE